MKMTHLELRTMKTPCLDKKRSHKYYPWIDVTSLTNYLRDLLHPQIHKVARNMGSNPKLILHPFETFNELAISLGFDLAPYVRGNEYSTQSSYDPPSSTCDLSFKDGIPFLTRILPVIEVM